MQIKKRVVSGITISGELTIAHYLVVIKPLLKLTTNYDLFLFIADFHAITTKHDAELLKKLRFKTAINYLSCGVPKETIFVQSEITGHHELSFLLGCHVALGELTRMTQFKSKTAQNKESFALLNYPLLMAADILIYDADVLVGPDQKQHVELTRNLAIRLNNKLGTDFHSPELLTSPSKQYRIRNLQNPAEKMSKSSCQKNSIIFLHDTPENIRKKIKTCVTDSENSITFNFEKKPGVSNLILLYALCNDLTISAAVKKLNQDCKHYLDLKNIVAESIIQILIPIQLKTEQYEKNPQKIWKILEQGNRRAQKIVNTKMRSLSKKTGFPFLRFQ